MYRELDSFLGWFDESDIDRLLARGQPRDLSAGEMLSERGARPEAVYVLVEGKLSVEVPGVPPPGETAMPGALLGGLAHLDAETTVTSVTALSPARVLMFPRSVLVARMARSYGGGRSRRSGSCP